MRRRSLAAIAAFGLGTFQTVAIAAPVEVVCTGWISQPWEQGRPAPLVLPHDIFAFEYDPVTQHMVVTKGLENRTTLTDVKITPDFAMGVIKGEWKFAINRRSREVFAEFDNRDPASPDASPVDGPPPTSGIEPYRSPPPMPYSGTSYSGYCVLAKDAGPL